MNKIWISVKEFIDDKIIFNLTHIRWNLDNFIFRAKKIKDFIKLGMHDNDFDFGYALEIEKYKLEKMIRFFTSDQTHIKDDYIVAKELKLAYNLLLIAKGEVDIIVIVENGTCIKEGNPWKLSKPSKWALLRYVNTKNASRYATSKEELAYYQSEDPKDVIYKEDLYQKKAWYLYNRLRYYKMNEWWD